jgi:hypothetical protein
MLMLLLLMQNGNLLPLPIYHDATHTVHDINLSDCKVTVVRKDDVDAMLLLSIMLQLPMTNVALQLSPVRTAGYTITAFHHTHRAAAAGAIN